MPDLATLQGILEEICDGGGAWLDGWANLPRWTGRPFAKENARFGAGGLQTAFFQQYPKPV